MRIAFDHREYRRGDGFSIYNSRTVNARDIARQWIKLGHEVYFVTRRDLILDYLSPAFVKENDDLIPLIARHEQDTRLRDLDAVFGWADLGPVNLRNFDARLMTGIFCFALSPLPRRQLELIKSVRNPLFIAGTHSYKQVADFGIDAHLFTRGVNHDIFNAVDRPAKVGGTTRFLWVGGSSTASAPDIMVKAYLKAFEPQDDVLLTMVSPRRTVRKLVAYIVSESAAHPPIRCTKANFSSSEMADLYRMHDAVVLPIRFHCACHPMSEAMACGTPVITTPWTGPLDYAGPDEALWIDFELEDVIESSTRDLIQYAEMQHINRYLSKWSVDEPLQWARPSIEHTAQLMRSVHEGSYDKGVAVRALERAKTFDWEPIAAGMAKAIEDAL